MRGAILIILLFSLGTVHSQSNVADSLKHALQFASNDTARFAILDSIVYETAYVNIDTAVLYSQKCLLLSQKIKDPKIVAESLAGYGLMLANSGNYREGIDYVLQGMLISEGLPDTGLLFRDCMILSDVYKDNGDFNQALFYCEKAKQFVDDNRDLFKEWLLRKGQTYEKFDYLDSAIVYTKKAYDEDIAIYGENQRGYIPIILGNIYRKKGNFSLAVEYYRLATPLASRGNIRKDLLEIYNGLARTFIKRGQTDSSIFYAHKALAIAKSTGFQVGTLDTYGILSDLYEKQKNMDSAVKYLKLTIEVKEKLFNQENERAIQNISFKERLKEQREAERQKELQGKIRLYILLAALTVFLVIAFILYRNNRHKQRAYGLLQRQKQEIDQQKSKVERALNELRTTQAQLIQSEKMASMGELTAGIAHEIQNPLNFVNNFSEVNKELLNEMSHEISKGNYSEVKALAQDVINNEEKVSEHGKRADAIVKNMLQHSRVSTGQKEPTDINALADEYLRLSYHGMKAKDKSFNATIQTDFDNLVGKIEVVPQEIGRVLLNLFNNAFYAVSEKAKQNIPGYEPTLIVSTTSIIPPLEGKRGAEIRVKDNGVGIPEKLKEKIFQPFFTTKPTGQGTGLGLSLAYDIIKAHGGEIKVETKEAEGTTFIVQLPTS